MLAILISRSSYRLRSTPRFRYPVRSSPITSRRSGSPPRKKPSRRSPRRELISCWKLTRSNRTRTMTRRVILTRTRERLVLPRVLAMGSTLGTTPVGIPTTIVKSRSISTSRVKVPDRPRSSSRLRLPLRPGSECSQVGTRIDGHARLICMEKPSMLGFG